MAEYYRSVAITLIICKEKVYRVKELISYKPLGDCFPFSPGSLPLRV